MNAALTALLRAQRAMLGSDLVALYLHGSLALGDFDPTGSDIDFVAVTAMALPDTALPALAAMHERLRATSQPWTDRLEGSYIPRAAIRRYDRAGARYPALHIDGRLAVEEHHEDWVVQRHILRRHGVVLAGPAPRTLIDPVTPEDLRRAAAAILCGWWSERLAEPGWPATRDYQAFAVLTMCRALHTLSHGTVVSKPVAARWAATALGEPWANVIDRALAQRTDPRVDDPGDARAFMRLAIARARAAPDRSA